MKKNTTPSIIIRHAQFLCCIVILICTHPNLYSQRNTRPNFVFIMADDCSYWDIGAYGSTNAKTPTIDKLAKEGLLFTQCFQSAPMCSPTRHNLYTGLYPVKTGAYPNHTFAKEGTQSIVHYLKPLGYRVALAGKRHISPESVFPFEYLDNNKNPDFSKIDAFLKSSVSNQEPFCLFITSKEPHTPWDKGNASEYDAAKLWLPPFYVDNDATREALTHYYAEINFLDGQVKQALSLLKKYKLSENTIVMFSSEQGNNMPFAKWTCYDAGVQSAFIVRWPKKIKAGRISDALIEFSDVVPTLIELAGGTPGKHLDGKSMVDLWLGKTDEHKEYAFSLQTTRGINNGSDHYGIRSVRSNSYRYIVNLTPNTPFKNNVTEVFPVWKTWKSAAQTDPFAAELIKRYQYRPAIELYHVKSDPYCMRNLANDPMYKDVIENLDQQLRSWMEECGDEGQKTEMEAREHQTKRKRAAR